MCGIAGILPKQEGRDTTTALAAMVKCLRTRGPEDEGMLSFPGAHIGQTRLSIIDIPGGHQPMRDQEHDTAIVFNGELYNYRELKATLQEKGHRFITASDTEVVLKAYTQYGEACVDHFDGMFAFGIWNERKQELFLARDRFGEKPLYVADTPQGFLFASEIKSLLATGFVPADIDPVALDNYLALSYVPPWRTFYAHIRPIQPAHQALYKNGVLTEKRYWQLRRDPLTISRTDAADTVRRMLMDSVESRMVADVEVGTFLSGGIDSGIVTSLAQKVSPGKIKAFSAAFEDVINELPYAKELADLAGVEHYTKDIQVDLVEAAIQTSQYFDEPFGDSSNIPTQLISAFARTKVKVVLSGDGGDELFYGYGQYRKFRHLPKLMKVREILRGSDAFDFFRREGITNFTPSERTSLLRDSSAIEADPTSHLDLSEAYTPLEQINLIDMYMGLPGDMLTKVDRSSMMHSLEVRAPFLNPTLAQFAYNLPDDYKTGSLQGKLPLADAFADTMPPGLFTRKKQGFGAPVGHWLRKPEFKAAFDAMLVDDSPLYAFLSPIAVQSVVDAFYAGNTRLQYKTWILFSLALWCKTHTYA